MTPDFSRPIDISIPLSSDGSSPSAWYVDPMKIEIVRAGRFVGSVKEGGSTNFRNITFNPHGNGTHTECVGHIAQEVYSLNQHLKTFHFPAQLISITPEMVNKDSELSKKGDYIITKTQVQQAFQASSTKALVVRTLPNTKDKLHRNYSNTNPCYFHPDAIDYIIQQGIEHLLVDLPSIDREEDEGKLLAHHRFWEYPENTAFHRTITEFVFVSDEIEDGFYFLNLMITSMENDASPSKPVLYPYL
jgi:kynurenine formamidase